MSLLSTHDELHTMLAERRRTTEVYAHKHFEHLKVEWAVADHRIRDTWRWQTNTGPGIVRISATGDLMLVAADRPADEDLFQWLTGVQQANPGRCYLLAETDQSRKLVRLWADRDTMIREVML